MESDRLLDVPSPADKTATQQYINIVPKLQAFILYLERIGIEERTRDVMLKMLKSLAKRADLGSTQEVATAINRFKKNNGQPASNAYKQRLVSTYNRYCKHEKLEWERPHYDREPTTMQPPTDEQVTIFLSGVRDPLSMKLEISAQTGLRPCEIQGEKGLQVKNVHLDQHTITARIHKRCNPRPPLKITPELTARLQAYITKHNLKNEDILFTGDSRTYGNHFRHAKKNLAKKLSRPELTKIRLYDLRHYYVTKQLRKTQNCEIVRQLVGHKHLNTTQTYLHLLADSNSGEWIVEGTTDKERAKELLKNDFTYQLTTPDGTMLFRKPK
jgi:integrase